MSRKLILYNNMLDAAGAVVTPSDEDPVHKFFYAYDREIGYPAAFGDAVSPSVIINQGAGAMIPDRLIIAGHNFAGMALALKCSPDNADWSTVVDTWTQADSSLINRQITAPGVRGYWGIFWSGNGSTVPQMTEIFLGPTYQMERDPSYGNGRVSGLRDGVNRCELDGGAPTYYDRWAGVQKRYRKWPLARATDTMAASINSLDAAWAGKRPFWVQDDDGSWFFAELLKRANQSANGLNYSSFDLEVLEVLPV